MQSAGYYQLPVNQFCDLIHFEKGYLVISNIQPQIEQKYAHTANTDLRAFKTSNF